MSGRRFGSRSTALEVVEGVDLTGRTAIVTGANSGIGVETTRALSAAGASVVLAVRNVEAGRAVVERLATETPTTRGRLSVRALDLTDLESVRRFIETFEGPLDLLLCNAGVMATPEGSTKQGFELQLGTNHLGHAALTLGLLPRLEQSPAPRVVMVSSAAHLQGKVARIVDKLKKTPVPYSAFSAYGDSKLANVLFAKGLAKRHPHILAVSLHPGVIPTPLSRHMAGKFLNGLYEKLGGWLLKSVPQGAATSVFAATSKDVSAHSGAYLADCAVKQPLKAAREASAADAVWAATEAALSGLA